MFIQRPSFRFPFGWTAAALVLCATGAGAATAERYALTGSAGSEGSIAVVQTSPQKGALQVEVAPSATKTFAKPFAGLGLYDPPASSNPPFGIGLEGMSTTGYGVAGIGASKYPALVAINSGTGDGLDVIGNGTTGIFSDSPGTSIAGITGSGVGVYGQTASDETIGVFGNNVSTGTNLQGGGSGVQGVSTAGGGFGTYGGGFGTYVPAGVVGEAENGNSAAMPGFTAAIIATTGTIGEDEFEGSIDDVETSAMTAGSANASGTVANPTTAASDISDNGDLYLTGSIYTHCSTFPYPTAASCGGGAGTQAKKASDGSLRETYAGYHASPTMEDEGESRMTSGYAHVALDPAFASMISNASPYLVFVTPQGDNRGVYVTHVTPSGFDVRESAGGRTTMTFDYRIVAQPYANQSRRLALVHPAIMRPMTSAQRNLAAHRMASVAKWRHVRMAERRDSPLIRSIAARP